MNFMKIKFESSIKSPEANIVKFLIWRRLCRFTRLSRQNL